MSRLFGWGERVQWQEELEVWRNWTLAWSSGDGWHSPNGSTAPQLRMSRRAGEREKADTSWGPWLHRAPW
jgi:hypothetical protein